MIKVDICMGSRCTMVGAVDILDHVEDLKNDYPEAGIEISTETCVRYCKNNQGKKLSPVVKVNEETIFNATSQVVMSKIMQCIDTDK